MKIAQVIPFFAPAWGYGGPVRVAYSISKELSRQGYEVTVLTTDTYDNVKRIDKFCEEMEGFRIFRFKNISNRLAKSSNIFLPIGLGKFFKKNIANYDIVHLHSFYTLLNVICSRICFKNNVPYILNLHEKLNPSREMGKSYIKIIFLALYGRKMLNNASRVFVLSEKEKSNLLKFDPLLKNKIEIVPNPGPYYVGKCKNQVDARKALKLASSHKVILSLSRISQIKGIDRLIKAFAKLVKEDNTFRLIIAGPDERKEKANLEQLINKLGVNDKIIFTGMAKGDLKEKLFCASDIFALFSRYESFGIVILESLAHGLPVCVSKSVGLAKVIIDSGLATIVDDPNDPIEGATKLALSYSTSKRIDHSSEKILQGFSVSTVTDKIIKNYQMATGR